MSSKILTINKLNSVSNFNFFFHNTKKNLLALQNFFNNQYLSVNYRNFIKPSRPVKQFKSDQKLSNYNDDQLLRDEATPLNRIKVLSCQDSDSPSKSSNAVPFKVTPRLKPNAKVNQKSLKSLIKPYVKLTKPNLTILVTLSSICSYALSPCAVSLNELFFLSLGTSLCSGAANAINMGREPDFDKRMIRTSKRPVVTGQLTSNQAYTFAALSGTLGGSLLLFGVNTTVAFLGVLNIVLYSWLYTSLKRKSIINTWVGALVGAIPPLMGWASSSSLLHPGAWCLAGLLYAWQFPHFNALSHNIASQYKEAGYIMTAAENPKLNARVSLRYSLLMFPLCFGFSYFDVTDWFFQLDSAIINGWLSILAYKFWRQQSINYSDNKIPPTAEGINLANSTARKLFWCSVYHLPVVLILAMLHKKGQWDRLLSYLGVTKNKEQETLLA